MADAPGATGGAAGVNGKFYDTAGRSSSLLIFRNDQCQMKSIIQTSGPSKFLEGEKMKHATLPAALVAICLASACWAQNISPLQDDASRGQLFDLMRSYLEDQAKPVEKQLYAFPLPFTFPHDALWRNPAAEIEARQDQLFGIDLSHHNVDNCHCQIDWVLLRKQHVRFAYLKVSQGVNSVDAQFNHYRDAARALPASSKVYVGPYHFLSAKGSGAEQAANFLAAIDQKLAADDLPPTMDLEWDIRTGPDRKVILGSDGKPLDFWAPISSDEIMRRAVEWLAVVEKKTGRLPLIYTNRVWWKQRIGADSKMAVLAKYPIWIADYSSSGRAVEKPNVVNNRTWALWQFSDRARFTQGGAGTGRVVDVNVFDGTMDNFRKNMGVD